jgi:signal transduction histidine kinase
MLNEPQVQAKGLTIEQRCAPNLPEVWADRMRIMQVLTNLLGNSIKFTPDGGVLRVCAERCAEGVRFAVSDSGPGISPQQINQVFERYWTGKSTRNGLGLGLFIARRIVAAHGGRIWVESVPGKGATFQFTLPLPPASTVVAALPREAPPTASSLTPRPPSTQRTHHSN